jgi:hypothetical protein
LRSATEAYVLLHEVAHFQIAPPARRRLIDFGLGAGPETGNRTAAECAATIVFGLEREREEAMASLLGILWEVELGQPGLASFLDQNWLEGADRPEAAAHFAFVLGELQRRGLVDTAGRPQRCLTEGALESDRIKSKHLIVTPAQAGVQGHLSSLTLDSRFHGNDDNV